MKRRFIILALALIPVGVFAQSQPAVAAFSLAPQAIALPSGKSTFVGTDIGAKFGVTQNIALRSDNVVSTDQSLMAFMGGFEKHIPQFGEYVNSVSPQLNGYKLDLYAGVSAGLDRVAQRNHYAFAGRLGLNYNAVNAMSLNLFEVAYMKLPGYNNNAVALSTGFKINW